MKNRQKGEIMKLGYGVPRTKFYLSGLCRLPLALLSSSSIYRAAICVRKIRAIVLGEKSLERETEMLRGPLLGRRRS